MKTITLTDNQFNTLFEYVDKKVTTIVDASVDYQDSEILEEWEDLLDVHTILGETKQEYERKLEKAKAKQPDMEWQGGRLNCTNSEYIIIMKVGTLLEELSKFDYDDNLVLYFLKNDELKSCQLESIIDANYEDDEGFTHVELTIEETEL